MGLTYWTWNVHVRRTDLGWLARWPIVERNEASDLRPMSEPMCGRRIVAAQYHGTPPVPDPRPRHDQGMAFQAACWCERTQVPVTPDDVKAGRTGTCGHEDCTPC